MKANLIPNEGNLTSEKKKVQLNSILSDMRSLEAEYRELCSIYRGANLLAQKVAFAAPGPGLNEKPLSIPTDRFTEESNG